MPALSAGPLAPRSFTRLYAPRTVGGGKATTAQEATLVPTGVRKLYLATHKRFYLVVCELHCFAAGFPTVKPAQACQTGFVVRRRSLNIPIANQKEARKQADQILKEINAIGADIAFWQQTSPSVGFRAKRRALEVQKAKANGTYDGKVKNLQDALAAAQKKLEDWRATFKVTSTLEGWIPGPFENIGSWEEVEETPKQTSKEPFPRNEASFPLFSVFPDPMVPLTAFSYRQDNLFRLCSVGVIWTRISMAHPLIATRLSRFAASFAATRRLPAPRQGTRLPR